MDTLDRMNSQDLAAFALRVAQLFRGERDANTWRLLLERIRGEPREIVSRALDEYGLRYGGGPKSRFIASKFLAYLDDARRQVEGIRETERRNVAMSRRAIEQSETAQAVAQDWSERRREIEIANPLRVGEAVDYLRLIGWGSPPADLRDWSRTWVLAVSDIVTGRELMARDLDSGEFRRPVSAREFYQSAGMPPRSLA